VSLQAGALYHGYVQTAQVSIWVPIVVAILGIIGVLIGQVLSARREDKHLRLTDAREDVRWDRELDRRQADLDQANQKARREERLSAYGAFLAVMTVRMQMLQDMNTMQHIAAKGEGSGPTDQDFDRLEDIQRDAATTLARVMLIGSSIAYAVCHTAYLDFHGPIRDQRKEYQAPDWVGDVYFDLLEVLRAEVDEAERDRPTYKAALKRFAVPAGRLT
jgi:hypothetical protein